MTYIHRLCIGLLSTNILFAKAKLTLSDPLIVTNPTTGTIPDKEFTAAKSSIISGNISSMMEAIKHYLFNDKDKNNIKVWEYNKRPSINPWKLPTQYIALGQANHNNSLNIDLTHYFFSLKEKPYTSLKGFEKEFANYFHTNKKAKVKFLYSYKKYDQDPWAMIAGNSYYISIWAKVEKQEASSDNLDDPLAFLSNQLSNDKVEALLTDRNKIIGGRINKQVIFKPDSQ